MAHQTALDLNDGRSIPQLGLGVWQVDDGEAPAVVGAALAAGYRLIDGAAAYRNERGVGAGVRQSGLPRDEVFVTSKLANSEHGYDEALRACAASLAAFGFDALDLYLIHWPQPGRNRYVETWKALVRLREEGRVRSIGVSNFGPDHLKRIVDETGVVPAVNQVELHPRFQQRRLRDLHAEMGIATQSWSPLGQGRLLDDPTIGAIAARHGKTPAQTIIRWHIDNGLLVIPKSVTPARIRENVEVFDFALSEADLDAIAALDDSAGRIGPDPDRFG
ncbi:aldo/keto reductase [Prosthecomicrobium pneumaticum]|uniref:2,5-diketo-D-gluconate reductase A n=1 Tax=Prosthecomicrobium pneumaticum TaxID=81895 RepID=A0A7W9CV51_9HYPH|nr:aldo/keto reductase [Prosthecomicrobium pneumaticum]MBB5752229.1 2,5-diketo-D-gluconate reductase A [Prosthecomicrobium pneumaticum]